MVLSYSCPYLANSRKKQIMTRDIKTLGLTLVAAMTLGAIGAQAASAHQFTSDSNSTVFTAQSNSDTTGSGGDIFTFSGGLKLICDTTYSGTSASAEADTVTLHPKHHNCSFGGIEATVDSGGCNYILDSDTTQASGHSTSSEHATVSLECEASHSIKGTSSFCNVQIETEQTSGGANHSLHGVRYSNVVDSSVSAVTITATVRTIKYTVLSGSFCSLAGLTAGSYANGSFDGLIGLTGFEHGSTTSGSTTNGFVWDHGARTDISVD